MKKLFAILFACVCFTAQAQLETPAASSAGSVSSRLGLTDIKIDYSRPKLKGRKIFGEGSAYLQPYGQIWRTGANSGTKISFSDDIKVEGTNVPKGTYLLFTWPGASEWTVALYSDLSIGGNTSKYDKSKEVANFKVKSEKLAETIQTLTFQIGDISDDNTSAKVQLAWENTSVKFSVVTDYDSKVMESIEDNLAASARYYYDNKKDLKQALTWLNQYLADPKNADEYFTLTLKANIQKGLGDKAGATATAQKSLDEAKKAGNDFYVKLNDDLIKSLK
jgi:hypothetical protein